jgi:DGQHR domain-containing protein
MAGSQLQESLKTKFSDAELQLSAAIGADVGLELKEKLVQLFQQLNDPLLSAKETQLLLQVNADDDEVSVALGELTADGILEKTVKTQRALDKEGVSLFRISGGKIHRLKVFGTASRLANGSERINFTIDGRLIRSIAAVDRLDALANTGQQRDEIIKHVREISEGIKDGIQVPNSVILTFNSEVFVWSDDVSETPPESWVVCRRLGEWSVVTFPGQPNRIVQEVVPVELDIPFRNAAFDEEKCALLVDGQQRTAALALVDVDQVPSYPLSVNATITSPEEAKQTFRVANNTVKISTDFSRALLGMLQDAPGYVKQERRIAQAVKLLAIEDPTSPFHKLVKHPGLDGRGFPVAYNTLFAVVSIFENSGLDFGEDPSKLAACVKAAYAVVKEVWPTAWAKQPKDSRLMHGAGLRAIGGVLLDLTKMQSAQHNHDPLNPVIWPEIKKSLERLATRVQWTAEAVNGTPTQKTNYIKEIQSRQNTNQDIQGLTNFLVKETLSLDKKAKEKNS